MAVEAVPHDLADQAANLQEALDPVELRGADGCLVAAALADQAAAAPDEVGLSAAGAQARLRLHALHEQLEIAGRKLEIEVELAQVVELRRVDGVVARVEGLDDAGTHASPSAILPADDADEIVAGGILGQDGRCGVGRPVVDDHPERGAYALGGDRVQRTADDGCLVAARRDEHVAAALRGSAHRTLTRCVRHHQPST